MIHKKISFTRILLFLFWFTFYRPLMLERVSLVLDNAWYIMHFVFLFLLILYKSRTIIESFKYMKKSTSYCFLTLFFLWNLGCVIALSPNSIVEYILEVVHVIEIIIVFKCVKKDCVEENLYVLGKVSYIYIWANFASMLMFTNGVFVSNIGSSSVRAQWLLGSKNSIPIYIMLFMIGVQAKGTYKSKFKPYVTCIVAVLSVVMAGPNGIEFMGGSSAGILACLGLFVFFIYTDMNEKKHSVPFFLSTKVDVIGIIVANIIILGGIMFPFINDFITSVLHKSLDYSGRRAIWEFALYNIRNSPIVGYGASKFGLNIYFGVTSGTIFTTYVYNMILRLWMRYGVISVVLYFFILLKLNIGSDRISNIMMTGILGICIFGLMNEIDFNNMFLPIIIIEELALQRTHNTYQKHDMLKGETIRVLRTR